MKEHLIKKVRKRDSRVVDFEIGKIANAIHKALNATNHPDGILAASLAEKVTERLEAGAEENPIPSVEQIQDIVERTLIDEDYPEVAKAYILYRQMRANVRAARKFVGVPPDEVKVSVNAAKVLSQRYLIKDDQGNVVETPSQLFRRVAIALAASDLLHNPKADVKATEDEFYTIMANFEFLPNSPTLMNAGTALGQLAACFVIPVNDSVPEIFDAVKYMAIVHQTGGGCTASDAHIYTTFCGVEKIETLYERVKALGIPEIPGEDHRVMDVTSLNIYTPAMDPKTGRFVPKQVTHLWQYDVPADEQYTVRCGDGTVVTTSAWHPFIVHTGDGMVERHADQLKPGDILPAPNRSIRDAWPFEKYHEVEGLKLDERLAWLVGYFLGDGGLGQFHNRANNYTVLRLYFCDGRPQSIEFAAEVLADHGVIVTPRQDGRGPWRLATTNRSFVLRFANLAQVNPGPKKNLTLPERISKSPLTVIGAFLGGLIDSDGYVSLDRRRIEFTTVCCDLAERLVALLSALGFNPSIRKKKPGRKGKLVEYRIHMADAKKTPELAKTISEWIHDPLKKDRLATLTDRLEHNTHGRIPLPFEALADLLQAAGVEINTTSIHKGPVDIGGESFWLHRTKWGDGIGEDKLRRLVKALRRVLPVDYTDRLDQLEHLADGWLVVEDVKPASDAKLFYDFTVADHNNYLAGCGHGKLAVIHNTGFSFSRLRPKGDVVKSTKGIASGPVSFMRVFDVGTDVMKQGGRRRGANMGILRYNHPDIVEFVTAKRKEGVLDNFNISVAVSDDFMEAVAKGESFDLINPRNNEVEGELSARYLFDLIISSAWSTGDPGLFFIDRANRANPTPQIGTFESTNPCGEVPLLPYEPCNLGSINLSKMVKDNDIDWDKLKHVVHVSTHFLDNVIDAGKYPLPQIDYMAKSNRKIGLGVMGFADMLLELGIPYNSDEAIMTGEKVMNFIYNEAINASVKLAEERGPFRNFKGSKWDKADYKMIRNATITTIAPTGTISIIANTSSGIEPIFAVAYARNVMEGTTLLETNPVFEKVARERGFYSQELMMEISKRGSIQGMEQIPEDVRRVFVTAFDIAPEWHVHMQSAFQKYVDNAVSKTVNLPENATLEDVRKVYLLAYGMGCKGITVYRYGSKSGQVLYISKPEERKIVETPVTASSEYSGGSCAAGY